MTSDNFSEGLQLLSTAKKSGELELRLARVPVPEPGPEELVVRVEAAPINPSDLFLLLGPADMTTARVSEGNESRIVTATIPERSLAALSSRLEQPMPVGNEGAGTVVKAGSSPAAQRLVGRKVAMLGGAMFSQYRTVHLRDALFLPDDATAAEGASCFVNPLTALAMVETMRLEGHPALIHTAAASNLGQMLNRICIKDGVALINVVRSDEQARLLRAAGAKYIVDSSKATYMPDLIAAITETGATLAFDAIGGGRGANQLLTAMEASASAQMTAYSRYGSDTFKQVYIYGGLDPGVTELTRGSLGFAWSVSGFLLTPFLRKAGSETVARMRKRVVDELKTTFASHYTKTISLHDALKLEIIEAYNRKTTGEKYLIDPSL